MLSSKDYSAHVYHIEHKKKVERLDFLSSISIFKNWSLERMIDINLVLQQKHYFVKDTIYDLDDLPHCLYIVQKGTLAIKTRITLTEENRYPTSQNTWEIIKTERNFEFKLCHLN